MDEHYHKFQDEIAKQNFLIMADVNRVSNTEFIESLKIAINEINDLDVTEPMKIVQCPFGELVTQNWGQIKSAYVDQYSEGTEGDSFSGNVYIEIPTKAARAFIQIPFRM